MLIAGLTLGVGILAVFLAIIYRITAREDKAPVVSTSEPVAERLLPPTSITVPEGIEAGSAPPRTEAAVLAVEDSIPADARLIASTVAGGRIVLTYDQFAGTIVIVVDPESLKAVGRLDLKHK